MMGEHSSYHNAITGDEAIRRLRNSGLPHCYLTRYSKTKQKYVLTVYQKQRPEDVEEHFPIAIRSGKHKIEGKIEEFENIGGMLKHYESKRINPSLPDIGQVYALDLYNTRQRCIIL